VTFKSRFKVKIRHKRNNPKTVGVPRFFDLESEGGSKAGVRRLAEE
jgi:hypothetical protein